jgi:hypothetical protein
MVRGATQCEAPQDISDVASREYALEKQLDKMQAEWNGLKFEVLSWKDTGALARLNTRLGCVFGQPCSCESHQLVCPHYAYGVDEWLLVGD